MSDPTDAGDAAADDGADMPDWLVDAVMSEGPPAAAIDVVKGALTWRTIDAELMALAFDSHAEPAGVRDASERRTLEFTFGERSVLVELDGVVLAGRIVPPEPSTVVTVHLDGTRREVRSNDGSFRFEDLEAGVVHLEIRVGNAVFTTPTFRVG